MLKFIISHQDKHIDFNGNWKIYPETFIWWTLLNRGHVCGNNNHGLLITHYPIYLLMIFICLIKYIYILQLLCITLITLEDLSLPGL